MSVPGGYANHANVPNSEASSCQVSRGKLTKHVERESFERKVSSNPAQWTQKNTQGVLRNRLCVYAAAAHPAAPVPRLSTLSCPTSCVTIAKRLPIEGRDRTRGKWRGSRLPVEGLDWQMAYFHLLRMLMGSLGHGRGGKKKRKKIQFIRAYRPLQTVAWLWVMQTCQQACHRGERGDGERKKKEKKKRGRERLSHHTLSGGPCRRRHYTLGSGAWKSYLQT